MSDDVADEWQNVETGGAQPPEQMRRFSSRAFALTLAGGLVLSGAVTLWLAYAAPDTIARLQSQVTSSTVIITVDKPDAPEIYEVAQDISPAITIPPHDAPVIAEENTPPETTTRETKPGLRTYPNGLPMHPIIGLHEDSADGPLPVIRDTDGLSAFEAYRRPAPTGAQGKYKIAIILSDYGLSAAASEAALRTLPEDVSLALSPYAANIDLWVNEARVRGHEIWVMLPTETQTYPASDGGPHTLLTQAAQSDNMAKLNWLMGRTAGYIGFITAPDSVFLESLNDARPVLNSVFLRGLGVIDTSTTNENAMPPALAAGLNAPYGRADLLIDAQTTPDAIARQLAALETRARQNGHAIGIIHPLPASYQALDRWTETLEARGFILAPASAIAAQKTGSE